LLAEQRNPIEVAGELGHTPQTLLSTYAHVLEELRGARRVDAEREIRVARTRSVRVLPERCPGR
jgi:hypothetical protein